MNDGSGLVNAALERGNMPVTDTIGLPVPLEV